MPTGFRDDPAIEDYGALERRVFGRDATRSMPNIATISTSASIFAEALMNRTPWQLWDLSAGEPARRRIDPRGAGRSGTAFEEIPGAWDHPGLLHMYIHLMEMSPTPERALRHGDRLVDLVPDSGHLVHMATHIDVLCGEYQNVVWRNRRAAEVDRKYEAHGGAQNFYTLYRIHNVHFEAYGAMFLGQPDQALAASEELMRMLPEEVVRFMPEIFESFYGKKIHVMVRFGQWAEILDEPFPADRELYSYTTAAMHQARTIALANLGQIKEAEKERKLAVAARNAVQEGRMVFNNTCEDVLQVGEAMMDGELAFKSGRLDEGLDHLRRSVALDDALLYDEPWGWMQPTRHALGALLMEAWPVRGGRSRLSRRPRSRRNAGARLPASAQRLEPARTARMPGAARRTDGGQAYQAAARSGDRPGDRADPRLVLLPQPSAGGIGPGGKFGTG